MGKAETGEAASTLFEDSSRLFGSVQPDLMGKLLGSAADVALVIEGGIIQDVSMGIPDLLLGDYHRSWIGKPWVETVTIESRPKIEELLSRADTVEMSDGAKELFSTSPWRQVNHPSSSGLDLPVSYNAVALDEPGRLIAFGRDLRAISSLQQRLVDAHQSLERDYSRLRSTEARYKQLFRTISQPVIIVDTTTLTVSDANPASGEVFGETPEEVVGLSIEDLFGTEASVRAALKVVAEAQATGESSAFDLKLKSKGTCDLFASAFRDDESTKVVLRIETAASSSSSTEDGGADLVSGNSQSRLIGMLEDLPDGLFVVGADLRILAANRAFGELTNVVNEKQLARLRIADFLGRSPTELNVLISNLKNHGVIRNFSTVLRDQFGREEEVEVSAVETARGGSQSRLSGGTAAAGAGNQPVYGFSVRSVARRLRSAPKIGAVGLPSSVDQLTGLIGRVPMKEIVQESTDFIERLCIEAALEMTGDNRASAAEMLGLSRQGLYSKLKRFGIDNDLGRS